MNNVSTNGKIDLFQLLKVYRVRRGRAAYYHLCHHMYYIMTQLDFNKQLRSHLGNMFSTIPRLL